MSNRFLETMKCLKNTFAELEKQGAEWTEDGTFDAIEIKDPQGLMDAVEKDSTGCCCQCLKNKGAV